MYDPLLPGEAAARAYLMTAGQFADVAAQEMYRKPGVDLDVLADVVARGRAGTRRPLGTNVRKSHARQDRLPRRAASVWGTAPTLEVKLDGADVLVIGRAVTNSDDPAAAAASIADEVAGALVS